MVIMMVIIIIIILNRATGLVPLSMTTSILKTRRRQAQYFVNKAITTFTEIHRHKYVS